MDATRQHPPKPLHFGLLLPISFVLFNLGYVVDQTIRWSDPLMGFRNGVFHLFFFGISWCVFLLPWSLLVFALYRWRQWGRFRTFWVLAPAVLVVASSIGSLVTHPPSPAERFRAFAKTELPKNLRNLHFHFSGGGIADHTDTYYFQTTPEEIDRLIRDMGLHRDEFYDGKNTPVSKLPDCPDFSQWTGAQLHKNYDSDTGWFYYLIVDSLKTQAYVLVGSI